MKPSLRPKIALLCIGLILGLLLLEPALRLSHYPPPHVSGSNAASEVPLEEKNQLGHRGQPIEYEDGDFVIVLLGDSQVEANTATPFDRMPERELERVLNAQSGKRVKVFTVGGAGYGQDQEWLALQRYFKKYRADMVILWETPRNDVWNNTFPTADRVGDYAKPTFWLEDGVMMGPSEAIGENWLSPIHTFAIIQLAVPAYRDWVWGFRLPPPYTPITGYAGEVKELSGIWNTIDMVYSFENLNTEKSHLSMYLMPASARLEYGLTLTQTLLQQIQQTTQANNAIFVPFYLDIENRMAAGVYVILWEGKYYRVSRSQFDQNVSTLNADLPVLKIPVTVSAWAVSEENQHLNQPANDQVIAELAARIAGMIP